MNRSYFASLCFFTLMLVYGCETAKVAQKPVEDPLELAISDDLIINLIDSVDVSILRMDTSGDGLFGRKIIYRDLSATKSATRFSGKVKIKVCINREGIVKYAEIQQDSSTIKDTRTLKNYLKAAAGYKFQPSTDAPDYECGSMTFKIDYW